MRLHTLSACFALTVSALTLFIVLPAAADSNTVSYQGVLRDATLNPVADGGYPMQFAIYNSDVGGTSLWGPEQYPSVATNNGRFSVYLGSILPLGTLFADNGMLWLEIAADTGTGMETYAPRVALASVPYAQYAPQAGNADTLDGLHASAFAGASHNHAGEHITTGTVNTDRLNVGTASTQVARGNHTHNTLSGPNNSPANAVVVDGAGNMGVGTSTPGQRLEVNGALRFTGDSRVMTRAPRVISSTDPRGGCPPAWGANTAFWQQPFTLTSTAMVTIQGSMIRAGSYRHDLLLVVDGGVAHIGITNTGAHGDWASGYVHWSGVLGPGNHVVWLEGGTANAWGCGPAYGRLDITIFE